MTKKLISFDFDKTLIMTPLEEEGKLAWRFNVPALENNIQKILAPLPIGNFNGPTLFLTGGKSSYVLSSDHEEIQAVFPQVIFTEIPEAGHWVHAEAPKEFLAAIVNFLNLT